MEHLSIQLLKFRCKPLTLWANRFILTHRYIIICCSNVGKRIQGGMLLSLPVISLVPNLLWAEAWGVPNSVWQLPWHSLCFVWCRHFTCKWFLLVVKPQFHSYKWSYSLGAGDLALWLCHLPASARSQVRCPVPTNKQKRNYRPGRGGWWRWWEASLWRSPENHGPEVEQTLLILWLVF